MRRPRIAAMCAERCRSSPRRLLGCRPPRVSRRGRLRRMGRRWSWVAKPLVDESGGGSPVVALEAPGLAGIDQGLEQLDDLLLAQLAILVCDDLVDVQAAPP